MTYDWAITLSPSHNYLIPNPPSSSPPSYGPGGFGNPLINVILNSCKTLYNENAQDYLGSFNGCHTILGHHAIMYMSNESECRWKYWLFGWRCGEWYPQRDTKNTWNLFANYWVDGHIDNPNTYYGLWDCYNLAIRDQIYTHDRFGVSPAIVWIWGYLPNTNQYGNGRNEHFTANGSEYQWPITSNSNFSYMGINYYRVAYGSLVLMYFTYITINQLEKTMKICILMLLFLFICANASDISIETDNVINDFIKNHKNGICQPPIRFQKSRQEY